MARRIGACAAVAAETANLQDAACIATSSCFGLQPHRSESFKLSTDAFFIEKLRDVVGLYLSPPDNALVLCVDEKSQCQALERTQPHAADGAGLRRGRHA